MYIIKKYAQYPHQISDYAYSYIYIRIGFKEINTNGSLCGSDNVMDYCPVLGINMVGAILMAFISIASLLPQPLHALLSNNMADTTLVDLRSQELPSIVTPLLHLHKQSLNDKPPYYQF